MGHRLRIGPLLENRGLIAPLCCCHLEELDFVDGQRTTKDDPLAAGRASSSAVAARECFSQCVFNSFFVLGFVSGPLDAFDQEDPVGWEPEHQKLHELIR